MRRLPRNVVLAAEVVVATLVVVLAWRALRRQWSDVATVMHGLEVNWTLAILATVTVLLTYLLLIEVWRQMVVAWGQRLRYRDGARIWFISGLARYVPGKLWQVGAMGLMAQRAGVSPVAASGSALIVTVANLLAGVFVVLLTGARVLLPYLGTTAMVALLAGAAALALLPVALPQLARVASSLVGREVEVPVIPPRALWLAFAGSVASWLLYGVAFQLICAAVLGSATGTPAAYITVYTASYLVGFVVLFAPGGVGFREMTMIPLMQSLGLATAPQAFVVAVTSRLWLTLVELGPGLLLLAASRGFRTTTDATDAN